MKKVITIVTCALALTGIAGIVQPGYFVIPKGETNASVKVSLALPNTGSGFRLDRVFVITPSNTYTGTVAVSALDFGYKTVIATDSSVTLSEPMNTYPLRESVTASGTNFVPHLVHDLDISINVNGGVRTVDRKIQYSISAE